jgi:hypothetical protein
MKVSGKDYPIYCGNKNMFQTTNQYRYKTLSMNADYPWVSPWIFHIYRHWFTVFGPWRQEHLTRLHETHGKLRLGDSVETLLATPATEDGSEVKP